MQRNEPPALHRRCRIWHIASAPPFTLWHSTNPMPMHTRTYTYTHTHT